MAKVMLYRTNIARKVTYFTVLFVVTLSAAAHAQATDVASAAASARAPLGPRIAFGAAARTALPPADAADIAARADVPVAELRAIVENDADIGYDADERSLLFGCHAHGRHSSSSPRSSSGSGSDPTNDDDNASDVLLPPPPRWPRGGGGGSSRRQAGQLQWRGGSGRRGAPVALTATPLPYSSATTPSSAQPGQADPGNLSQADVFKLHSRPGAPAVILLDFDGHVTRGTAWNGVGAASIATPPYSTDNDTSSFSAAELANIVAIWRQVAEDFAPWLVDVTTEDGGLPLSGRGVRVAIGGTCAILGKDCTYRGVAYLGAFGKPRLNPAFAFSDSVADGVFPKGAPKYTADIISHEVGHTLGLGHDGCAPPGQARQEYYSGHGVYAPIMGRPYPRPVSQWSKGEYSCATNRQDDTKIISRRLTPAPDDHGGDSGGATPLAGTPLPGNAARSFAEAAGAIGTAGDSDWFAFAADAGTVSLSVDVVPSARLGALSYARADADLRLDLYGPGPDAAAAGATPLASWDPQGALLSGAFTAALPAKGTYYIALTGVGDGGPEVGYTSYGSLGEYRLGVEFPSPAGSGGDGTPDLAPGLRVKVESYAGETDGAGATRVASVRLAVTDETGAPVPRAAVTVLWTHEPATDAPPDFKPTTKKAKAKKQAPAAGVAVLRPSPAAAGPGITLRVLSVEAPPSGGQRRAWNRGASDVATQFRW